MKQIIEAILERMEIYTNIMAAVARREMTQAQAWELMGHMTNAD